MKYIYIMLFAGIALSSCGQPSKSQFADESLNTKLATPNGQMVDFGNIVEQHKGKPVVIEFWASWCGDCVKAMPKLKQLQASHTEAEYVFISLDKTTEKWKAGIEKHGIEGDHYLVTDPTGMKGGFGKSVDLDWIPRYIVLDATGKIVLYRAIETDFDLINETLNKLK